MQNLPIKGLTKISLSFALIVLLTVFGAGALVQFYFWTPKTIISYISQSEILELEKARLDRQSPSNKQLFFGQPEKAIAIIKEAQNKNSTPYHIVLLAEKAVYGKEVKTISQEVYREITRQLQSENIQTK